MSLKGLFSKKTAACTAKTEDSKEQPELLGQYALGSSTTSTGSPYGIAVPSTTPVDYTWTTGTGISTGTSSTFTWPVPSETAEFKKLKCKLPESTLEKLMMIGLIKSKKVLKQRIKEEFTKWCDTQEIDVSVFPMLLAACVVFLEDENENLKKEEK